MNLYIKDENINSIQLCIIIKIIFFQHDNVIIKNSSKCLFEFELPRIALNSFLLHLLYKSDI